MKPTSRRLQIRLALVAAATAGILASSGGFAATETENLMVTASVTATCTISTTPVAFGDYDPTSDTDLDSTGTVTLLCTNGTAGYVTLSEGGNPEASSTAEEPIRQMVGGADTLGRLVYHLYSESTRTDVWGNTPTTGLDHMGDGSSTELTVYGRIPAEQNVIAGSGLEAYTDTVVATVTF